MAGDIGAWLEALGLGRYAQAFAENEIDFNALPHITEDDLKEIGVALGARRQLLAAIHKLDTEGEPTPAAGGDRPAGAAVERRQLTVMFVDLVGSTALSARLDPEDMSAVLRRYQDAVAGEVARFEGHVAKFMGDGVLVYFGYPRAHEDEAERAVRAALAVIGAVARGHESGEPLAARIGIATGQVVVGDLIGEGAAREEVVVGETPNLAARMQELADPNSVVVAQGTRALLGDLFELEDLGARTVKGFAAPAPAWRVRVERPAESRFMAARAGRLVRFVGREQELALLEERWQRVLEGEGQVVLLAGEAGIGKSRLTEMLLERLGEGSRAGLRYQCSPHHVNSALYPFINQLERAAGFAEEDDDDAKLDKLEALLGLDADDAADTVPLFAALLSVATGGRYPALELGPQQQMQRIQSALVEQLARRAERRPVLVIFEDSHWADPTTLEVLDQAIGRIERARVLVVVSHRPEFEPPWRGHSHVTVLTLIRLGRDQCAALTAHVAGDKQLPPEVLEQIVAKTDGVPLFVEELTKTVLQSGLIEERDDRYEVSGPLPALAIPSTLQDSLIARLDHLGPAKDAAQTGAVIGREFPHRLLAAVSDLGEDELAASLDRLVDAELVFRRGAPPDATYVFKHALVCDAAYETLLKRRRQTLHARIFSELKDAFPRTAETEPELLAFHATRAGLHQEAADFWLRAGRRAASRSADLEAVGHLRNGLAVLGHLPEDDERDRLELSVLIALGPALMATVGWDAEEVDRTYSRARRLAARTGQPAVLFPAVWGLWLVAHAGGAAERARELLDELLALAAAENDETLLLQAHHAGGSNMCSDGVLHEARQHIAQGIALYRRGDYSDQALRYGGHDPCVCAHSLGALNELMLGHLEAAERYSQGALELARHVEHRPSVAHAYWYRAELCQLRGEPVEAGERARKVLEIAEPFGLAHYSAWARILIAWSRARQGEVEAGRDDVERGVAELKQVGISYHLAHRFAVRAETLAAAGAVEEALRAADECLNTVIETGERWFEPEALRLKARIMELADGAEAEAVTGLLERAVAAADELDAKYWKLRAATPLARLWRGQGRADEARALLAPLYGWFSEGLDSPDLVAAKAMLDELA